MTAGPFIAEAAALIGDPARANMLAALMDGRALAAGELAYAARIAPSTASGHLSKLMAGGLVSGLSQGRHRYYRLASEPVARVLEGLMALAAEGPPRHRPRTFRDDALAEARTCYDHFAGKLGVGIADAMMAKELVILSDEGGMVTEAGGAFLKTFAVEPGASGRSRRAFCKPCLDWSERRWHLGGTVGAGIASRAFELGWVERVRDSRAVKLTDAGKSGFAELFALRL